MKTVIIKYNSGNVTSVAFALERLGLEAIISDEAEIIRTADKVILPGVGEASSAMNFLREKKLDKVIVSLKQPLLGICLGMQLLCDYSEEGNTNCLGIVTGNIRKFSGDENLKVPQMGWNKVYGLKSALFDGIQNEEYMYFVHGYYLENNINAISSTNYGVAFSSGVNKDNFYGVQFHPEKSGIAGSRILENFIKL